MELRLKEQRMTFERKSINNNMMKYSLKQHEQKNIFKKDRQPRNTERKFQLPPRSVKIDLVPE